LSFGFSKAAKATIKSSETRITMRWRHARMQPVTVTRQMMRKWPRHRRNIVIRRTTAIN